MRFGFELSSEEGIIKDGEFGVEFYAVASSFVGDTFKSPHEIQVPEGSTEFAVGNDVVAEVFLLLDDFDDFFVCNSVKSFLGKSARFERCFCIFETLWS